MCDELSGLAGHPRAADWMLPSLWAVNVGQAHIAGIVAEDGDCLPPVRAATVEPLPRAPDGERVPDELVNPEQDGARSDFHFQSRGTFKARP